jgi:acetyl-CoA carboxylase carboxyltransferase component
MKSTRQPGEEWRGETSGSRNLPLSAVDDWKPERQQLADRREAARAMGGTDRLAKHRGAGADRLDARARVSALCDPGSFVELGTLAGDVPADAFIAGHGLLDGRPVMVGAEDFTVAAGSIGAGSNSKRHRIAELALADRIPLIMLLEGAGHRPTDAGHRGPTDTLAQVRCSGKVPIVAGVFGPSAGHGALVAPIADFTVMTPHGAIFTAGPPVVHASLGEEVSKEDLGGPSVALTSGLIHNGASGDTDALDQIRTYLSYMPPSAWSYPPSSDGPGSRTCEELFDIVPRDGRRGYDMRLVLAALTDDGFFEIQARFGPAIICALARIGGHPVAIVANQPLVMAGAVDAAAADKAAHFIAVADAFHVPLLFVTDNPGMLPGSRSEREGVLRSGGRMFAAEALATTPKINLTLRKAYGFGSMVMAMISYDGQAGTFAFPGVTLGAMGADAMSRATGLQVDTLRGAELEASYRSAQRLGFDEMIDPSEARDAVLGTLNRVMWRRQAPAAPVQRTAITP